MIKIMELDDELNYICHFLILTRMKLVAVSKLLTTPAPENNF